MAFSIEATRISIFTGVATSSGPAVKRQRQAQTRASGFPDVVAVDSPVLDADFNFDQDDDDEHQQHVECLNLDPVTDSSSNDSDSDLSASELPDVS